MGELVVVVGTDDGKSVYKGHPGDSSRFLVYSLRKDGFEFVREVENEAKEFEEEGEHGSKGKMKKVLSLLGRVDVILSRRGSPNLIRMAAETEIQPVIIGWIEDVEEGLRILKDRFDEISSLVDRRKKGERPEVLILKK